MPDVAVVIVRTTRTDIAPLIDDLRVAGNLTRGCGSSSGTTIVGRPSHDRRHPTLRCIESNENLGYAGGNPMRGCRARPLRMPC